MNAALSERACHRCKQRRVKCDKALPGCQRCQKYGSTCPGYPSKRTFINQNSHVIGRLSKTQPEALRSRGQSADDVQPSSDVLQPNSDTRMSDDFSAEQYTSGDLAQSVDQRQSPQPVALGDNSIEPTAGSRSAINTPNSAPALSMSGTVPTNVEASLGRSEASSRFISDPFDPQTEEDFFDLDIESYYADGNNLCGFFPGVTTEVSSTVSHMFEQDDQEAQSVDDWPSDTHVLPEDRSGQEVVDVRHSEIALLVRLFVEILAPWMDMFDINAFFTRNLPIYVNLNPLLRYSLAAVAAKQTARFVENGPTTTSSKCYALLQSISYCYRPNEWFYKAASYYDRAISNLRVHLTKYAVDSDFSRSSTHSPIGNHEVPYDTSVSFNTRHSIHSSPLQHSMSAIAVLSMYENLDDLYEYSSQHLRGFLALFGNSSPNSTSAAPSPQTALFRNSPGRAAFWYFARKELFSSYAHRTTSKLDPTDSSLWVAAGIPIEVYIRLSDINREGLNSLVTFIDVDDAEIMAFILLWLATKAINQIATQRRVDNDSTGSSWKHLCNQLQWWYDYRPRLFRAYATVKSNVIPLSGQSSFSTAFFSAPISAATLQVYHFVQILLLLNQPDDTAAGQNSLARMREIKHNVDEVAKHSREICSIALGSSPFAIQRQMGHPLQLAGAYFDGSQDHEVIHQLLANVARETCSTV